MLTAKRNRLTTDRVSKWIYVKHNLKLQNGKDLEYFEDNNLEINNFEDKENERLLEKDTHIDSDERELIC